jgi:hypothetical protein
MVWEFLYGLGEWYITCIEWEQLTYHVLTCHILGGSVTSNMPVRFHKRIHSTYIKHSSHAHMTLQIQPCTRIKGSPKLIHPPCFEEKKTLSRSDFALMRYQINKTKRPNVTSYTVSIIYKTKAAAATSTAPAALAALTAAPVNSDGRAEVGVTGEPPVGITVVLYEPVAEGAGRLAPEEGLAP